MVISKNMEKLVAGSSVIRKLFEEGIEMANERGAENVFDFSLGNPNQEPPARVKESIQRILEEDNPNYIHGYMKNAGYPVVREAVAKSLQNRYHMAFDEEDIIMTVGAAGGLNCILRVLLNLDDETICFAPFFGEYRSYIANFGGQTVVVPANRETFQLNLEQLDDYINEKTKVVIVNNPNNPTGVIYSKETLMELQKKLELAEQRIGHPIYVVSDEPYRDLVYDGNELPFMPDYIKNCIIAFSFSKSLSLPGERIGYLAVPKQIAEYEEMISALVVANRCLGYINAPSLFQLVIKDCLEEKVNLEAYNENRTLIYNKLTELGFESVKPQGAFYLFVKSPTEDEAEFVAEGKKYGIIMVPATTFGCAGYVRIAYCVSKDMILRSFPAFEKLAQVYAESK